MKLEVVEDAEAFARRGAEIFVAAAVEAIATRGRFSVALTGGSTPGPIHRAIGSDAHRSEVDWSKVDVFFGDERAGPPDARTSNYGAAREQLLRHVGIPDSRVHRMQGEQHDLAAVAAEYEQTLGEVCDDRLDLLFVGVGSNAHILSLYPGAPAIDEQHARVVAEIDPPMDPALSRITMTPVVIAKAHLVLAIATGPEKKEAVRLAIEGTDDRHRVPAQLLRGATNLIWLLDRAAASGLSRASR